MDITICSLIKNEHAYLNEWIDWHLNLGFQSIHLFEDFDSKSHSHLIERYNNVYLHQLSDIYPQFLKVYKDRQWALFEYFIQANANKYNFCAFIDIDEFIYVEKDKSIFDILKNVRGSGLYLYWKNFGANGHVHKPEGGIVNNYTKPCKILDKDKNMCFKSIVNLFRYPHFKNKHKIAGGEDINGNSINGECEPIYKDIYINHYITKSLDEYTERLERGNVTKGWRTLEDFYTLNPDIKPDDESLKIEHAFNDSKNNLITLCAIAKNEDRYIEEWVDYHLNLGIDKIIIYDNNDEWNLFVEHKFRDNPKVEVVNVRGKHIPVNKKEGNIHFHGLQQLCYEHCYSNLKDTTEWMLFIDIDEFLTINGISLQEYLKKSVFNNVDVIQLNWNVYGDNGLLNYEDIPVLERFKTPAKVQLYDHVKSLVRCGKPIEHIDAHIAYNKDFIYVNNIGEATKCDYKQTRNIDLAYLRHYSTKTIEEFIERKYNNTSATGKDHLNKLERRISEFFTFNEDIPEKWDIVHKTVNRINKTLPIVSFTSYGKRLDLLVPKMIKSLKHQTMKPWKIVMCVFKNDVVPQSILDDPSIEIIYCDTDLKSHLKYFETMQKYRENPIITVDDDVYYDKDLIKTLYNSYKKYPNCVSAIRTHKIKWDKNILPYKKWDWECSTIKVPSHELFATGVGGVIYPPNILNIDSSMLSDIEKCLTADDVYLKYLEYVKDIKVVHCGLNTELKNIKCPELDCTKLFNINVVSNKNDEYINDFLSSMQVIDTFQPILINDENHHIGECLCDINNVSSIELWKDGKSYRTDVIAENYFHPHMGKDCKYHCRIDNCTIHVTDDGCIIDVYSSEDTLNDIKIVLLCEE